MKRVSMVLGIMAGIIGLGGAFLVFSKIKALSMIVTPQIDLGAAKVLGVEPSHSVLLTQGSILLVIVTGVLCAVGAILGLIGGILVSKNSAAASTMMAAGAALSVLSDLGIVVIPLMMMGSIFVLTVDEQQKSGSVFVTAAKRLGLTGGITILLSAARYFYINALDLYYIGKAPADYYGALTLLAVVGGAAAVAGSLLVKQRHALAGVLMLIGAVMPLMLSDVIGTLPVILLLVGGVFAFVSGSKPSPESVEADAEPLQDDPAEFAEGLKTQE